MNFRVDWKKEWPTVVAVIIVFTAIGLVFFYAKNIVAVVKIYNIALALLAFPMIIYDGRHPKVFGFLSALAGVLALFI